jgi:NAD(P)-dependent dehydrogenase (short-subunit alcohol dehydrogenase family)
MNTSPEHKSIPERFKEKVCIVTGGSAGIGKAIVEEYCHEGGKVLFTGLDDQEGTSCQNELNASGFETLFVQGDMGEESFCQLVVDMTVETFGEVNHLVNNAFSFVAKATDATTEDWKRSLQVGPIAYAHMVRFCQPHMRPGGAIVNMSSISAHIAQTSRWTYNSSKGAVNQLTKCQAMDLAPNNIRVNSIDPGWIWTTETDKAAALDGGGREKWDPIWGKYHLLRRMGHPIEVARATLFLLSNDASFITGTNLMVDGGYSAMGPEGLGETTVNAGSY